MINVMKELMARSSRTMFIDRNYKEYYKLIDLILRIFREMDKKDITKQVSDCIREFCKNEISSINIAFGNRTLDNNEYRTLTDTMLKLNRQIKDIAYEDNNVYIKTKSKLLSNLDSGKLIPTSESTRNTGKTTALIEISKEYSIPIIMPTGVYVKDISSLNGRVEVYTSKRLEGLRGKRFDNGVLIDEGISFQELKMIDDMGIKIRTGFFYSPYFI